MSDKIRHSDEQWRAQLSPEEYRITREAGTEPAFTGRYHEHKEKGIYACVCCGTPLFDSAHKYDSGSGWPSYWQPIDPGVIDEHLDRGMWMTRTEVRCSACDAHLGHVFPDGPRPTGLRYCINSAALKFSPDTE